MKSTPQSITGILLAGGLSRRMDREKGTLKIGNRLLLEYPLKVLETVCDEILISTCKDHFPDLAHPVVCDETAGIGPMGGIYTCLRRSASDLNIVLSYDMPLVNEGVLKYLIDQSRGWEMVVPAMHVDKPEPLCAVFRKCVTRVFADLIKKKSYAVYGAIPLTRSRILVIEQEMPFYHPDLFLNINQMEDLDRLPDDFGYEG
jgi:molybdopterin-guanine dinucleotide biosynthesis protein A